MGCEKQVLTHGTAQINLTAMLSERGQARKDTWGRVRSTYMIPYLYEKSIETESG